MNALETSSGRPVYRYYIAWMISGDLALEVNLSEVSWSRQIRRAGTLSGKLHLEDNDRLREAYWATMPGKMALYVTRNNVPVWGGYITRRSYEAGQRLLSIDAVSFEGYLYRRHIWHDTVQSGALDQYQVARNLIALMQTDFAGVAIPASHGTPYPDNANIGLEVDASNSGQTQDTQVWLGHELQNFGEALEGFSDNLFGFEYNIEVGWNTNTDKFTKKLVFRPAPPSQLPPGFPYIGDRPGLHENYFEFPGNIVALSYDDTVDDVGTRQWVTGSQPEPVGETEQPVRRGVWENEAYLGTQWPVFEVIESSKHSDVSEQETLDWYARSYGQRNKPPASGWSVTVNGAMNPHVGTYNPGDWCRLVVTDPFLSQAIDSGGQVAKVLTKRIQSFTVAVPDTEQVPEVVTLTLIDEWNDDGGL